MAVEVDQGMYLSQLPGQGDQQPALPEDDRKTAMQRMADRLRGQAPPLQTTLYQQLEQECSSNPTPPQVFRYNPTHDLESLFWIALYFVVNKEAQLAPLPNHSSSSGTSDHRTHAASAQPAPVLQYNLGDARLSFARELFYSPGPRVVALIAPGPLHTHFGSRPAPLNKIGAELQKLRYWLYKHYTTIEQAGYKIDKDVCKNGGLYSLFITYFSAIAKILEEQDVTVSSLPIDRNMEGILPSASRD